jgi:hypothetical protein
MRPESSMKPFAPQGQLIDSPPSPSPSRGEGTRKSSAQRRYRSLNGIGPNPSRNAALERFTLALHPEKGDRPILFGTGNAVGAI